MRRHHSKAQVTPPEWNRTRRQLAVAQVQLRFGVSGPPRKKWEQHAQPAEEEGWFCVGCMFQNKNRKLWWCQRCGADAPSPELSNCQEEHEHASAHKKDHREDDQFWLHVQEDDYFVQKQQLEQAAKEKERAEAAKEQTIEELDDALRSLGMLSESLLYRRDREVERQTRRQREAADKKHRQELKRSGEGRAKAAASTAASLQAIQEEKRRKNPMLVRGLEGEKKKKKNRNERGMGGSKKANERGGGGGGGRGGYRLLGESASGWMEAYDDYGDEDDYDEEEEEEEEEEEADAEEYCKAYHYGEAGECFYCEEEQIGEHHEER